MKHNPVVMKTTLNGSRHIVLPKRRLRIHRASNEIPFFLRNRQRRENAKMPPKKKIKPIAGQQTIAAAFSEAFPVSSVSCWSPPLVAGRGPVIEPIELKSVDSSVTCKIHRLAAPLYKPQTRKMGKKAWLIVRKLRYTQY